MKVIVNYDRVNVVCKYDMNTLSIVKMRKPNSMILFTNDEAHDQIARIDISMTEDGVSKYGVTFNHDSMYTENTAVVSIAIPSYVAKDEVNEWIRNEFGMAIVNCSKIEDQIAQALNEITEEDRLMDSMVEICDNNADRVDNSQNQD